MRRRTIGSPMIQWHPDHQKDLPHRQSRDPSFRPTPRDLHSLIPLADRDDRVVLRHRKDPLPLPLLPDRLHRLLWALLHHHRPHLRRCPTDDHYDLRLLPIRHSLRLHHLRTNAFHG